MEGFYQESGRAGRDGLPAQSILYFHSRTIGVHRYHIQEQRQKAKASDKPQSSPVSLSDSQFESLQAVEDYCLLEGCRRRKILKYFGEELGEVEGKCCDFCTNPQETRSMLSRLPKCGVVCESVDAPRKKKGVEEGLISSEEEEGSEEEIEDFAEEEKEKERGLPSFSREKMSDGDFRAMCMRLAEEEEEEEEQEKKNRKRNWYTLKR